MSFEEIPSYQLPDEDVGGTIDPEFVRELHESTDARLRLLLEESPEPSEGGDF